jgi:WD40 repeat protein
MKNNPYIGPRPYGRGEGNFFGRDREGKELAWLILAERAVLFYAQSGAGKTSLLNARVIPTLEQKDMRVLPVARVSGTPPASIAPERVDNVFVYSALLDLAAEAELTPDALLEHTLLSYLQTSGVSQTSDVSQPILLIFDQFEEIATTHRAHWDQAEGFFRQVRAAIDALPGLGVLFVLREDYVAELDPYTPLLPSHLQARFRMTLPTREQAMQIVMGPAEQAKCPFTKDAAHNLVRNLSRIKGRRHASGEADAYGQYVEPVQLQVVCQQLWESLDDEVSADGVIEWDEIKHYNVDDALTMFYENTLTQTCQTCQVSENLTGLVVTERRLRRWISETLITPDGRRNLVLQGAEETAGLPNAVVRTLRSHHLIRAESRGGSRYYELAHDRLVKPIMEANEAWEAEQERLHPWRPVARQWQQAQSDTLLYRGEELEAAQSWLEAADPGEVEAYEQEFIRASLEAQEARVRRRRLTIIGSVATIVLMVVMAALTLSAVKNRRAADRQALSAIENQIMALEASGDAAQNAQAAHINQLSAQALAFQTRQYDLALLLSVEAFKRAPDSPHARNSLLHTLQYSPRLVAFLQGHSGYVGSVAFSPDGAMVASGSGDNTIILWDVATRSQSGAPLTGHDGYVASIAFSPDGKLLASGGQDGKVILWDMATRESIDTLTGHTEPVLSVAFARNGKLLASGSWDETVRLWDVDTRQPVGELIHSASVASVAFAPEGKMLAAGTLGYNIILWDMTTYQSIGDPLSGHTGPVLSVAFARYGDILASGSQDNTIRLWDISNSYEPKLLEPVLMGHKNSVLSVAFTGEVDTLASASADNTVILWDVKTRLPKDEPLVGHSNWVRSVAFSPDGGKTLASGSYDKNVLLWNVSTQPLGYETLDAQGKGARSVVFSPDGSMLASGGKDNTITLWDMATQQSFDGSLAGDTVTGSVTSMAFAPSGGTLASGHTDQAVILWDVSNPHTPTHLSALTEHTATVNSVAFAPNSTDGEILASASDDTTIMLWDVSNPHTPTHLSTLTGHEDAVNSVAFAPDSTGGKILASASDDTTIMLWDVSNPREPVTLTLPLEAHHGKVVSVAFAPNGKTLASGSWDNVIILWDVSNPRDPKLLTPRLTGHQDRVLSVAFAPDGKTIASGSRDKTIILWDVETRQRVGRALTGHSRSVESVMFEPDSGRTLASGNSNEAVFLWDVASDSWAARACRMANRNFMPAEWKHFVKTSDAYHQTCPELPPLEKIKSDSYEQDEDYLVSILQPAPILPDKISLPSNAGGIEVKIASLWNAQSKVLIRNASELNIDPAAAVAFVVVQSGGRGFGEDGRMIIRFENQVFWDYWGKNHPDLYAQHFTFDANQRWRDHQWRPSSDEAWRMFHGDQIGEWEVFEFARSLDETAAMESISMGMAQIMGFNYASMGYASVQDMFRDLGSSESAQLDGLFQFLVGTDLIGPLQTKDFTAFAHNYNGPGQAERYGSLMQQVYDTFKALVQP